MIVVSEMLGLGSHISNRGRVALLFGIPDSEEMAVVIGELRSKEDLRMKDDRGVSFVFREIPQETKTEFVDFLDSFDELASERVQQEIYRHFVQATA
jgi:hypothetical protein